MSKISLIIKREYSTRVRKKSFIIMSLIGPVLFAVTMVLPAWLSTVDDSEDRYIAVIDETSRFHQPIPDKGTMHFLYPPKFQFKDIYKDYHQFGFDAFVVIPNGFLNTVNEVQVFSEAQITIDVKNHITYHLDNIAQKEKLDQYQIEELSTIIRDIQSTHISVKTINLSEDGKENESSVEVTMVLAIVFATLIYFLILLYGTQVMKGVIEEKTNRIVEVIISSVKPFQLMMGKIVGIALVALTQFLIWGLLSIVITTALQSTFNIETPHQEITNITQETIQQSELQANFEKITNQLNNINLLGSLAAFIYFFLGGYLLYASLFAAVGAALDNETDSQQFVMPIMLPLILSIYISFAAFRNPGGDIAFWFSMIPLTSPIVMMARIPFQIPTWEIMLSMLILCCSFILTTWFAGRVYRTGILMYGKKVSYKEIWKWFRYAGK